MNDDFYEARSEAVALVEFLTKKKLQYGEDEYAKWKRSQAGKNVLEKLKNAQKKLRRLKNARRLTFGGSFVDFFIQSARKVLSTDEFDKVMKESYAAQEESAKRYKK